MKAPGTGLAEFIHAEVSRPLAPEVTALADRLLAVHGDAIAAILFYGSCLRDETAEGILDFYVLVDDYRTYHRRRIPAALNAMLPPTVSLWSLGSSHDAPRAKVAVMSFRQFARRMKPGSLDVSLWARFCQPAALAHVRSPRIGEQVVDALSDAAATAALWAARFGPVQGTAKDYWLALFRETYRAELRPENPVERAEAIFAANACRYEKVLKLGWAHAGIGFDQDECGLLHPKQSKTPPSWLPRKVSGKFQNIARLVKSAFTFENGADYVIWKIERHSGYRIHLSPWQRNYPLLAAPLILWRLWRAGILR